MNRTPILLPLEEARARAPHFPPESYRQPEAFGENHLTGKHIDLQELAALLDWPSFFRSAGFRGRFPELLYRDEEADRTYQQALEMLGDIIAGREFDASLLVRFFQARREQDDIVLENAVRLPMLRQQESGSECLSLADFLSPEGSTVGLFLLRVEETLPPERTPEGARPLRRLLRGCFTEALARWMQERVSGDLPAIRPEIGGPMCPDRSLRKEVLGVLQAPEKEPEETLCGLLIAHPQAHGFAIGPISDGQRSDYGRRRKNLE